MAAIQGMNSDSARPQAQVDFRVYASDDQIPNALFYYIESTAPDSVEQRVDPGGEPPDGLRSVDPDEAVKEIAATLTPENDPGVRANLVVMVHGFNTPRDRALDFYGKALEALEKDKDKLFGDAARRTVFVGYRWPSERIGSVLSSSVSALPAFPLILLIGAALTLGICVWLISAILKLVGVVETDVTHNLLAMVAVVCVLLILAAVTLALLRGIVYFRDVYRATNYGVPDLVEVIRQIDREVVQRLRDLGDREAPPQRPRIALSFVGHSMGGLIVTNSIRVLSDVFRKDVIRTYLSGRLRPEMASKRTRGRGRRGLRPRRACLQFDAIRAHLARYSSRGASCGPREFPGFLAEALPRSLPIQQRRRRSAAGHFDGGQLLHLSDFEAGLRLSARQHRDPCERFRRDAARS